ncbi:extracellular solute-binding protein [Vagococcus sp. BWB3-3]|uniref:Extracellular solute-binding protein n=1 Tax=Vagococcus allomyrinae TaxID=2794353 RepID=A0A940STQ1_9ENTE|nr:ABC transporter substrate-binding protein [Vagococcus allomyrinae]MBP1040530.1 extracellular solute-binding protein [Vagococcus allomyrinae]
MKSFKKVVVGSLLSVVAVATLAGCSSENTAKAEKNDSPETLETIIEEAKKEGEVASVGMPDTWANWVGTWTDLTKEYGLKHQDTDMSSAEELAKFESEGKNGTADIGDVGISFGPLAVSKDLTLPYKTSYWDEIPEWAKDQDGHWLLSYTGTIAFMTDSDNVKDAPTSWADLAKGDYQVAVGDVTKANQAQFAVLAAAIANGGDEGDIQPGLTYFKDLAKAGRISSVDASLANIEKGEVDVTILWDFNALNYRDQLDSERFKVTIPTDGSVMSGYTTLINKNAPHPNAAKLTREYILSDEGQINLAKGYARPIREKVKLPAEVADKLLSEDQYQAAQPVKSNDTWDQTAIELPEKWQSEVLVNVKK